MAKPSPNLWLSGDFFFRKTGNSYEIFHFEKKIWPRKKITDSQILYWPCFQGKDIVFKFIIEYSSLMDFGA